MSSFYGNSGGSGGQGGGLTPEQLALIENAQWKSEEKTELFDETVSLEKTGDFYQGTLAYSEPITADILYVTFNGEEYTCPRIDAFNTYFYGGFTEQGPDFSEFPFCIGGNIIYSNQDNCTISAITNTIAYTDTFKAGVENFVDKWRVI